MAELESQTNENLTHQDHDDIDEDDEDPLNSPHKVVPTVHQTTTSEDTKHDTSKTTTNQSNFNVQHLIKTDLKKYVNTLIPKDHSGFVHCHIKREKEGRTKALSTVYYLYFDGQNENDQSLLLIARKHLVIGGHSEYFIGYNVENPSKNLNEQNSIAKLRRTKVIGHEYVLYDHQKSEHSEPNGSQSAAIIYDEHIFGSKEPRKITVLLHDTEKNIRQLKDNETIIDEWRAGRSNELIEITNASPTYDEESKTYSLNFLQNRVKLPSHKNFQLKTSYGQNEENIIMQFGRIDENNFALDYRYPLRATEAFAIALSSFYNQLRT